VRERIAKQLFSSPQVAHTGGVLFEKKFPIQKIVNMIFIHSHEPNIILPCVQFIFEVPSSLSPILKILLYTLQKMNPVLL